MTAMRKRYSKFGCLEKKRKIRFSEIGEVRGKFKKERRNTRESLKKMQISKIRWKEMNTRSTLYKAKKEKEEKL